MTKHKNLSNPFSTGGGGVNFEVRVQASFVTLMLTGGYAPCFPCWPIAEIKFQGKVDGFDTDDLIVFVKDDNTNERRKFLGQIKRSIKVTKSSTVFGEVIQAAWNDFNNPNLFVKGKDIIALITGPLNATDADNVQWLLNQARHTKNFDEFLRRVQKAKFSPSKSTEKLEVIKYHLKKANDGNDVSNDELYDFLKHFHLLGYDLSNECGVVLSLMHSHISQFQQQYPHWVWPRIVDFVQTWNQSAGTITHDSLPKDLLEAFEQKTVVKMPEELKRAQEKPKTDWMQHPDATYLTLAMLIGTWQDKSQGDLEVISKLLGITYDDWLNKAREILLCPDSPLSVKNGIWTVDNRTELWDLLGSCILDQNLDRFRSLAISVLEEPDPVFELPAEERYAASIHGKVLQCSHVLRKGIAEGLSILGTQPEVCGNCSQGKVEETCVLVIRELLTDANWVLWGSLNDLLPTLAEAAPGEFLVAVEKAMCLTPCPFDELFSQKGNGITRGNYLTGLLWALEVLAWDEQHLVRVCVVLGELASHDPGGQWTNRPSNSLATILLPWFPQTLASVDKRNVAVQTLLKEWPDIAWNLIIQFLPDQHQTSSGSYKPRWRKITPDDREKGVTHQEYWQQVSFYAELAVVAAGQDAARLCTLINHFDNLPKPAFDQLLEILASQPISELPEEQQLSIWDHLTKFTNRHRRFSEEGNELIIRIEQVAKQLAPTNPFNLYQHLFTDRDFELYEGNSNWEEQQKKLDTRRETAVLEIFQQEGVDGLIRFAESVSSSSQVGHALSVIDDETIERTLLPHLLDSPDNKHKALVSAYIWRCNYVNGWEWCDKIDKSDWAPAQIGQFLACLPFAKEAWDRASEWLQRDESEYWTRADANPYKIDDNLTFAIGKLIIHDRPYAAINCLERMHHAKQPIDANQCVKALLATLSSSESNHTMGVYPIVELIKFLQAEPSVNEDDLFKVEWAYVRLLDRHSGFEPKLLASRLANDPNFFCEVIRLIYMSKKDDQPSAKPTEESRAMATNAWRLLHEWKTPPGTQKDGIFCDKGFTNWLQTVKKLCTESGHLEVALISIGEVLIYTPPDPDGLWIRRVVAAALNDHKADDLRKSFRTGAYNSRGVHQVDPTGKPEKELAEQFRSKAEAVENAGFHRFATSLRKLADDYVREAERIISDHKGRKED